MDSPKPVPPQPEIRISDNLPGGEYANMMEVHHNREELFLTFFSVFGNNGRVTGKIITSPAHLKRMIAALDKTFKHYEETFGPVEAATSPKSDIGFTA